MTFQATDAAVYPTQIYPVNIRRATAPPNARHATHPQLGPVNYTVTELPLGPDEQVAVTLGRMVARSKEDSQDPEFQARAIGIVGYGLNGPSDDASRVEQAYAHTKGVIQFQRDEITGSGMAGADDDVVETIIRPVDMARYVDQGIAVGDCDDFSSYLAAILEAVDIPCGFVTVAADQRAPDQYSHVYVAAYPMVDGRRMRVPLDASHGDYPGWEVPNMYGKIREWPVSGSCWTWALIAGVALWAWPKVWPVVRGVFR